MSTTRMAQEQLTAAWHELQHEWGDACELWADSVRERFARDYWEPTDVTLGAALRELENLTETVEDVQALVREWEG